MKLKKLSILATVGVLVSILTNPANAQDTTARCRRMFNYREQAVEYLESRSDTSIDPDGDGIACQMLPSVFDSIPQVDPWRLERPIWVGSGLGGERMLPTLNRYYDSIVLAGGEYEVLAFMEYYNLGFKSSQNSGTRDSAQSTWAGCGVIYAPGGTNLMVCVAVDENGNPLDERILSNEYNNGYVGAELFGTY